MYSTCTVSNYLPSYEGIFEDTFVLRILSYEDNLLSYEDKSTRTCTRTTFNQLSSVFHLHSTLHVLYVYSTRTYYNAFIVRRYDRLRCTVSLIVSFRDGIPSLSGRKTENFSPTFNILSFDRERSVLRVASSPRPPGDAFDAHESRRGGHVRTPGVGAAARAGARSRARDGARARAQTELIAHRGISPYNTKITPYQLPIGKNSQFFARKGTEFRGGIPSLNAA